MKNRSIHILALIAALAVPSAAMANAGIRSQTPPVKADNTKTNKTPGPTADQQSQAKADVALTKQIRQAILKDKTLSVNGHNCKVITKNGLVTLRGPVKSAQEKSTIDDIAVKAAGAGKVTNELVVKSSK